MLLIFKQDVIEPIIFTKTRVSLARVGLDLYALATCVFNKIVYKKVDGSQWQIAADADALYYFRYFEEHSVRLLYIAECFRSLPEVSKQEMNKIEVCFILPDEQRFMLVLNKFGPAPAPIAMRRLRSYSINC